MSTLKICPCSVKHVHQPSAYFDIRQSRDKGLEVACLSGLESRWWDVIWHILVPLGGFDSTDEITCNQ